MKTIMPLEIQKIGNGYNIFCRVHIRKKQYRMMVDTGSSVTLFEFKIHKELTNNELEDNGTSFSFNNVSIESKSFILEKMRMGNIEEDNIKIVLIDLDSFNMNYKSMGLPKIDGILGGDVLFKFGSIINYDKREMILFH